MKRCNQCNLNFEDSSVFCPNCGQNLVSVQEGDFAPQVNAPVEEKLKFNRQNIWGNNVVTEITVNNNILDINQYKKWSGLINYGRQNARVNMYEITDVITKKSINFGNAFWLAMSLIMAFSSWYFLIAAALFLFALRSEYLYIYFPTGYVKIPDATVYDGEISKLVEIIRRYNPNSIRVIMDK